jgi:hypothetical protein
MSPTLRPNVTDKSTIWQKTDPNPIDYYQEVRDDDDTSYIYIDFDTTSAE